MSDRLNTVRKGVTISFGMVSIPVDVANAKTSTESNTNVCVGIETPHAPARVTQPKTCEHCGKVAEYQLRKAREVGDTLVLLDTDALKAAKNYEPFVKKVELAAHPAPQVATGTVSGDKIYYLLPAVGSEGPYAVLAQLILTHPELAFCGQYAPRTSVGLYQVSAIEVKGSEPVLMMRELELADALKSAPVLDVKATEGLVEMGEKVLRTNRRALVSKFTPAAYADESATAIAAIVEAATLESVPAAATTADPMLDALQAMLDQAPKRTRKPKGEAA